MPPKTQRSRACTQCRDRRVKCDETPGCCLRCRRLGLSCSGPVTLSIIDMTDKVTRPRQRKKKEIVVREDQNPERQDTSLQVARSGRLPSGSRPEISGASSSTPSSGSRSDASHVQQTEKAILVTRYQHRLPILYQPSNDEILDRRFLSHFVSLNVGVRSFNKAAETPFIAHLPGLHMAAKTMALRLSIRAASMAFYAKMHADAPILADSYRWYYHSLISQRKALARLNNNTFPSNEECLAPVILALYEVYAGTSPSTVFQHLAAATQMLAMRGPENCSSDDSLFLFIALRVSEANKAVVFNRPSVFSSPEWMTLPFSSTPKTAHMLLIDILLSIPACIHLTGVTDNLNVFFSGSLPPNTDLKPVRERALQLLQELEDWAERHPHLSTTLPVAQVTTEDMTTPIDTSTRTAQSPAVMLPNSFVAMATGGFNAARLVLTLLLHKVSDSTSPDPDPNSALSTPDTDLLRRAAGYAKNILKISAYIESTNAVGFNFLRCVFPLTVVAMTGPSPKEKNAARHMLNRWGEQKGLKGLTGSWVEV